MSGAHTNTDVLNIVKISFMADKKIGGLDKIYVQCRFIYKQVCAHRSMEGGIAALTTDDAAIVGQRE